jgi:hypothetical protein
MVVYQQNFMQFLLVTRQNIDSTVGLLTASESNKLKTRKTMRVNKSLLQ